MMKTLLIFTFVGLIAGIALGQETELRKKHFNTKKNIALEGYDAVSYFQGEPKEGKPDIRMEYKGIVYQFANPANLQKFKATPSAYEPAYGGWCAYAMGENGEKVKIDPETFTILDGKLYLFYNFWGNNTLKDWKKSEAKLRAAGDQNWNKTFH